LRHFKPQKNAHSAHSCEIRGSNRLVNVYRPLCRFGKFISFDEPGRRA